MLIWHKIFDYLRRYIQASFGDNYLMKPSLSRLVAFSTSVSGPASGVIEVCAKEKFL